ncbi:hypothetical protein HYV43_07235 [Candidatus Micrarchaeota archaeon]|nr:hypothetical protein [Candidatus Micrarchaeota archaeon]
MANPAPLAELNLHRFTVGNKRFIGLELPELAKKHDETSAFIQRWRSVYSNVLSQVRSRIRADARLFPGVAREFAEIYARKSDLGFHARIQFQASRSGKVLLKLPLESGETDYRLEELAAALKDHEATFGCEVNCRHHRSGKRP